jgi:DedD protein
MSREAEIYKDKIEVNLDARQVFYLFFGGSVIVGLVFVLGVMVGRRVEARGYVERAHVDATLDPLAALDRLEGSGAPSFGGALKGADATPPPVDVAIEGKAKSAGAGAGAGKPSDVVDGKVEAKADAKPEAAKDAKPAIDGKDVKQAKDAKPEAKEAKADAKDAKPSEDKQERRPRYTLQLSSFQDRAEAEAFSQSVKTAGFQPYIIEGDVDGKQFYRVRIGSYRSLDAANDAKADVEKAAKKSAIVTKL